MSTPFFTMLKTYFHCCANRYSCCFNSNDANEPQRDTTIHNEHVDYNQFTFDDLSNPNTPNTPMTSSSSSSSLEDYKTHLYPYPYPYPYKRPQFKPIIGIIPTNYYSD